MIKNISSNWYNNGNLLKLLCSKIKKKSQNLNLFIKKCLNSLWIDHQIIKL